MTLWAALAYQGSRRGVARPRTIFTPTPLDAAEVWCQLWWAQQPPADRHRRDYGDVQRLRQGTDSSAAL